MHNKCICNSMAQIVNFGIKLLINNTGIHKGNRYQLKV